jgi:ribosomal protein S18 acetylase RimI-like enzyme
VSKIIRRAFSGQADLLAMAALARVSPADNLHVIDLAWRFSSWAFDDPDNVGLWVDGGGQMLAWAVLQAPFWTIDYAFHPDADRDLYPQFLAWADNRARQVLGTPGGRPRWYVNVFSDQTDWIRDLAQAGFASQADVGEDSWSMVLMQRSSETPVANYTLPAGVIIRPLAGESEVSAYVDLQRAVFGTDNMTLGWRSRTLHQAQYVADLDLVAVAPDGGLVAFCICWLDTETDPVSGQVEPLGVHPDWRKSGLGRAILSEDLRRLQSHGASQIYVETDSYRNAALELYESAGFRVIRDILVYRKDYEDA